MLFQKRLAPAPRCQALNLSLRTLRVGAEPAEIVAPDIPEQENIDLVVGNADAAVLEQVGDGTTARAIERAEIIEAIDRDGEVDVLALVEDFDPVMPERREAGTSRTSGGTSEPNNATARTCGSLPKSAAIASAARRNVACCATM